jgi:hypothetical protein
MADRTGEAVEADHDEGLAGGDVAQEARQHRPAAVGARGMLFEYGAAARGTQFVELRVGALVLGGHPRVADQAALWRGFLGFGRHDGGETFGCGPFLQINKVFVNDRLQRWPAACSRCRADGEAGRFSPGNPFAGGRIAISGIFIAIQGRICRGLRREAGPRAA